MAFSAHEGFLSRSPVFDHMCKAGLKETGSRHIDLPEDDAEVISRILHYLYCDRISNYEYVEHCAMPSVYILTETYIAAGKYLIPGFKEHIVEMQEYVIAFRGISVEELLSTARRVYANIPDSDTDYPFFLRQQLSWVRFTAEDVKLLNECIARGGKLAIDIHQSLWEEFNAIFRKTGLKVLEHPIKPMKCDYEG